MINLNVHNLVVEPKGSEKCKAHSRIVHLAACFKNPQQQHIMSSSARFLHNHKAILH